MFTTDKPVIFAYHGYPWLIHRRCYRRHGHDNFHVRGYKEEGTTTTPFDMTVMNDLAKCGKRDAKAGPGPPQQPDEERGEERLRYLEGFREFRKDLDAWHA